MKKYSPQEIEQRLYSQWESAGYFAPRGNSTPFSIMIPPPNVTGTLHMGHAFQHSLVDSLIRFRRMKGDRTLWQMGTDHAGIATQLIVTEQLAAQGIKPTDLGREQFLEKVWEWKENSGGVISTQLRRLGASLHWDTERFTLDEGLSRAVREVFVQLYDEGLIYRGKRLVNWDPALRTSISDLEVESEEEKGHLWHFRYPLAGGPAGGCEYLVVATTRPETMLGDTAVAVHPDDERYKDLVGKEVLLPLCDRRIPVIADHYVDSEFGTGCVKITPGHDFNDNDVGTRHDLAVINVFNEDATVNDQAPAAYRGLDRYEARNRVLEHLERQGLVEKVEEHTLMVPRGEKSGVVVEPFLSDQWFVDIKPLAEPAIKVVEDGEIEFIPNNYENNYFAWMREIQDWCISRQQWWGHRIPAWYDEEGNVYVAHSEQEARAKYGLSDDITLSQDEDVLDTWFSSALWTFSTLGWPEETEELELYHPSDVMVTGHDIITFWVSRMIMMTLKFRGEVPFRKVYVTGLVTDAEGQKMSKSKGNGLDPLDIIDGIELEDLVTKRTESLIQPRMAKRIADATRKEYPDGIPAYGTDALRFTFYAIATRSRTIKFDLNRVEGYRNFCNKLWNAANFVFMNTLDQDHSAKDYAPGPIDRWILAELQKALQAVNQAMETCRFDLAAKAVYGFVWDEFCDWYLELCKPVLADQDADESVRRSTRHTLITVLETTLRMAHPFIPFITEELWQQIPDLIRNRGETVMLQAFPEADDKLIDEESIDDIKWLKQVVTGTRNIRGEMNISFAKTIPVKFFNGNETDKARLNKYEPLLESLIKAESFEWIDDASTVPVAATHLVGDMEVLVPMAGLIDKEAEIARLDKEISRKQKDKERAENKINNPNFVEKAPDEVVQKEKDKLLDLIAALDKLEQQKSRVASL